MIVSPLRYAWLISLTFALQWMMRRWYPNYGPDTSTGLLPMPQILIYYAVFYFFGAMYFDCEDTADRLGRWWRVTIPVALLVVFPVGYDMALGGFGFTDAWIDSPWYRPSAVALQVVYAWLMSFALIGSVSSALLLVSYQWLVRYSPIGTLLNGPRKRGERVVGAALAERTSPSVSLPSSPEYVGGTDAGLH